MEKIIPDLNFVGLALLNKNDTELFNYYKDNYLKPCRKQRPFKRTNKISRNDSCMCGSNLKFKKCCI